MHEIRLSSTECAEVEAILAELIDTYPDANDATFLQQVTLYAARMPQRLRAGINGMRHQETVGACRITGFAVDDEQIGATPRHWADTLRQSTTIREDFFFVLCATLLGDVFCWSSQQGGRLVNEVVPIKGDEDRQINSGSTTELLWHTEDAFHPYRADYIGLMCLRNPDRTETMVACLDEVPIAEDVSKVLFEQRFVFRPDDAHLPSNRDPNMEVEPGTEAALARSYARIEEICRNPEKTAVLFGDPSAPYIRLDSDAIERDIDDPLAVAALDVFMAEVDKHLQGVVLEPGDVMFVDNYRAVHGRQPFKARFDGRDRWLRRVNITRDIRKSRDSRTSATARVVY
ncbi:TauD/TfdA family dioxygenase [Dactylosporangium sp. NBC_01737]|uniref:guanitoxin biosynthesis L-enduracididine beta-hydroxylase GntD n=1 Tax=Dactylosporangium sp. NBC_01737 TaxID=2975959 RepID=UPI002E13F364|nr:TauD/TfdA family dioxygenase [Dactylosporangium sp. NBC_01737]